MGHTTRKPATKKLAGPALDRYLRRFFTAEPGLPMTLAQSLAARANATFSSLRVRALPTAEVSAASLPTAPAPADSEPPAPFAPPASFDPYAIGLVPTFQREGRDGLIAKLASIMTADQLRKMARAQQVVLPDALRQGDVEAPALRAAIADAVAKRIADRKAAAG